jgi:hypothetical protein
MGSATALTLARETGAPRATVYRLRQRLLDDACIGVAPLTTASIFDCLSEGFEGRAVDFGNRGSRRLRS